MQSYEYQVLPAPRKAEKFKGAKTLEARYAQTLAQTLNDMAREGWEFVRSESLPVDERSGLTSRTTSTQNMLVFRRPAGAQPLPASPTVSEKSGLGAIFSRKVGPLSSTPPAAGAAPLVGPATGEEPKG